MLDRDLNTNQRYASLPSLRSGKLNHMLRISHLSTRSVVVRLEDYQRDPIATAQLVFDTLVATTSRKIFIPQGYKGSGRRSRLSFLSQVSFMNSLHFANSSFQCPSRPSKCKITHLTQKYKDYLLARLDIPTERLFKYP